MTNGPSISSAHERAGATAAESHDDVADLAREAGIALAWSNQAGQAQTLSRPTIMRVLEALGHGCDTPQAVAASRAVLRTSRRAPAMVTARVGEPISWPMPAGDPMREVRARLVLESGGQHDLLPALTVADRPGADPTLSFAGIGEPGYHRLEISVGDERHSVGVAIAPPRAFDAGLGKAWGMAVQLHSLRPETTRRTPDPGLGDFGALAALAQRAGAAGAQVVAISPNHAGFSADASHFSPYSPSSRLFHNVLFIDPESVYGPEAAAAAARVAELDVPAASPEIEWSRAGKSKLRWLRALFDARPVAEVALSEDLRLHATFETLHAHFHARGLPAWTSWPEAFQDPASPDVIAFASANAGEVRFHAWLQQTAEAGLAQAQRAALASGMRVGLLSDLAIGMSGFGSHAWASREDLLVGLEIGAPPDMLNPNGQSWGLTAFSPQALVARRFQPFIATLRAAMRHAGGVRIDHVLGLNRLWLTPTGLPATEGAFVQYPLRDLINLLILESHRQRAIVIGEDLGTVPEGFREVLADAGILGMQVLWLERNADGVGFTPPPTWSPAAVAMTTTHDLPTVAGWWQGRDLAWRARLGREADPRAASAWRDQERAALALLAPHLDPAADGVDLALAAVAQSPASLMLVPIEDLLGIVEQPNLPGTIDEHPNWRQRLRGPADRLFDDPTVAARLERLTRLRGG